MAAETSTNPEAVLALLDDFSVEMTGKDVPASEEAAPFLRPGTRISVTFLGNEDLPMRVAAAAAVKQLGFVPVPHVSARRLTSQAELEGFLDALARRPPPRTSSSSGEIPPCRRGLTRIRSP